MKSKLIIIAAFAGTILAGCNTHETETEIALLNRQKDSLLAVANYKDQTITDFTSSFSEIQDNLSEITQKQNAIADNSSNPEMVKTSAEQIKTQISDIKALMDESKAKLQALSAKFKKSNIKIANFEKMVADLNNQLGEKDKEITALNEQIATLNTNVTTLKTSVDELKIKDETNSKIITDQTNKMNTAYIAIGTSKQLSEKKVVAKHGGVLGMGKTETLEPNVNKEAFSTIDISKIVSVPVNSKDCKIVTSHPTDSYKLEHGSNDKISELVITDPEKFWSESKYLVVLTDK